MFLTFNNYYVVLKPKSDIWYEYNRYLGRIRINRIGRPCFIMRTRTRTRILNTTCIEERLKKTTGRCWESASHVIYQVKIFIFTHCVYLHYLFYFVQKVVSCWKNMSRYIRPNLCCFAQYVRIAKTNTHDRTRLLLCLW